MSRSASNLVLAIFGLSKLLVTATSSLEHQYFLDSGAHVKDWETGNSCGGTFHSFSCDGKHMRLLLLLPYCKIPI